jgi:uncharacterized protein YbjT (DUF2867 family)
MRIAVTGGTGRIGGRVVELLTAAAGHEVVALSSRTAPYDNPSALRAALDGVDTLVFVSGDGEAARVVVHHRNVVQAATQCQVGHVVLLSGLDVDLQSPFCYAYTNGDTERLLRASGRPYSIVRASLFTEFFLSLLLQVSTGGPDGYGRAPGRRRPRLAGCPRGCGALSGRAGSGRTDRPASRRDGTRQPPRRRGRCDGRIPVRRDHAGPVRR